MRIALDISSATPARTGIGTYTWELARRLVREPRHEWILLFNSLRQPPPDWPELRAANVSLIHRRIPGPALLYGWKWFDFPSIDRLTAGPVDLFHSPATYIPPQRRGMRVTTVHDLHFRQPGAEQAPLGAKYLNWVLSSRMWEMDLVITDAPSVAREVEQSIAALNREARLEHPDLPGELSPPRIEVIPLGVDETFFDARAPAELDRLRRLHNLPESFLLHVGGWGRRKNLRALVRAMEMARRGALPNLHLVVAGPDPPADSSLPDFVRQIGYVPAADLPALYRLATAFVFPSLHEGFGLPVLEAMASGCPVLASRQVAVTELLPPDCVVSCDATNLSSMEEALSRALSDPLLLSRLARTGPGIARQFTWDETARKTLAAYEALPRR